MRRRILASAALLAGSALLLSACAPSGSSGGEQATGDDVTLKVWSWRTEDVEAYNKIFDVFEEEHPGITVEFEAFQNTEYNQILTTGLAGSDGPDVPMVRAYGQLQPNVEAGQLEPIDGDVDGLDAIAPSVIAGAKGKADGKTYAVPLATQTLQMFYNKQIFKEQGLEVPTTWAEFIDVQEKLLAAGITPMALGAKDDWILPIFADIVGSARYGGSEFEQKVLSGETDFNDPDYVASLGIITELQKYLTPDVVGVSYTDSQIQFTSGQAAQFPGGSFEIATFRNQAPDLEFGSYQVPVPDGAVLDAPVSPAYADGNFAINAKSKNKEAALELLNWFATPEFGQLVADELNQFSAIPGVEYEDAVMKEAWANYEDGQAPYLLLVDFRYGEPLGTAVLGTEVQKMFLGQTDAAGAAAALQTGISQWFTPGE
ncbi:MULTISPECIES: extracellular solute-binding protein [Agromyces]|uniref:ABC transporter substrate-binding protein n=1 Tax=Agromyces TaxID=33877 RepID=UPI001E3B81AA|nr:MULTISPECIES: extracellular solute-binding protein [Agromyces]MCD1570464.1 extracellular solute-binding protein [Agromyces mediolanus]GLU88815.1 ABC transporter substrate-binding protein [Agromyces sp. NBRC 114283]